MKKLLVPSRPPVLPIILVGNFECNVLKIRQVETGEWMQ